MTEFYYDQARNLLIYPSVFSQNIQQAIPESRTVNGNYIAVPRTLRNCQVLRHFQYPVPPIMTDYDWPAPPGVTPYESQKTTANFLVTHPRCFNLSDMGCVAGETLVDTALGPLSIAELSTHNKVAVRCLTPAGPRYVEIKPPFRKGLDELYRVTFKSGRSIVVTKHHVFLTCRGWLSCAETNIGEQLPVFDVYPQQSIWEPCRVKFALNAHHLKQIEQDYRGCSEILFYDAPLLSALNTDLSSVPSLGDVLRRIQLEWRTDVQGKKYIRTTQISDDRQSKRRCGVQIGRGEMGYFLSVYATKLTDNQFHISAQCRPFPTQQQEVREDQELRLCMPLSAASASPFDTVTHIAYERTDVYYDMEVPSYANYIAHGLCNHNTGKTNAVLWAADWLMRQHQPFRALIVCPLSIMERVWVDAIYKNFLDRRKVEVLYGDSRQRSAALSREADFYIVNFDGVSVGAHTRKRLELDGFSKQLAEHGIDLTIVDEASAYKDSTTKRHRIARLVFGSKLYLWLLSGTPTPNSPTDAYGLAKLVNNAFGKSFTNFKLDTMYQSFPGSFKWLPKKDGYDKARKLLTPSIRFDIKDVWDGPELTTQQREVPLTEQQKKLMADLKRDFVVRVKSGEPISAANEAAVRQKFIQISLGAIYDEKHKAHAVDAKPRLTELKAVIEEAPGKLIIFSPLTSIVSLLYKELGAWTREIVNGDVSQKDRSRIFSDFQSVADPRILIADPRTASHGLNLWMAQTVVWYGAIDSAELYVQANKRAHRPGQRYPVTVVQLVSNALEREIYKRLESNTALQGALLDVVRKGEL